MPLKKGYSRRSIAVNIKTERKRGRPKKQALAIALETARRAAQAAGKPDKAPVRPRKGLKKADLAAIRAMRRRRS